MEPRKVGNEVPGSYSTLLKTSACISKLQNDFVILVYYIDF